MKRIRALPAVGFILVLAVPVDAPAQSPTADSAIYVLSSASRLEVKTGKAGLLGFAGHDHVIRAGQLSGRIAYYPGNPTASHLEITVATAGLEVLTPPDSEEIRKVTEAMRTQVLEVERYPEIGFISKTVAPTPGGFRMTAELTIKGQAREVPVDVTTTIGADTIRATTTFTVRQTDYGIKPFRGGPAGTVRVADRVRFTIDAVAIRKETP